MANTAGSESKESEQRTRFNQLETAFTLTDAIKQQLRTDFVNEMERGLADDSESSLKMLGTCVTNLPTGSETGIYYSLDWGGTNYRVLRSEFFGHDREPNVRETKVKITEEFQRACDGTKLFNFLAEVLKEHMEKCGDLDTDAIIGFTFSFPMMQHSIDEAILINWTKGFDIHGVEGQNVTEFMNGAFERHGIRARIGAVCNDTTGTLMACAFEHPLTRVGLILGTGINAAYVEPSKGGEIINTELGNFSLVPQTDVDRTIDAYTPNAGKQFTEKMVSGFYLGEIVRVFAFSVFGDRLADLPDDSKFKAKWGFESALVSRILDDTTEKCFLVNDILTECGLNFSEAERVLFREICQVVVNRSADLAATVLSCVIERVGEDNVFVGIDGSVYKYMHGYENRMRETLGQLLGVPRASHVNLVHASDGSGKGAALVAAAALAMQS